MYDFATVYHEKHTHHIQGLAFLHPDFFQCSCKWPHPRSTTTTCDKDETIFIQDDDDDPLAAMSSQNSDGNHAKQSSFRETSHPHSYIFATAAGPNVSIYHAPPNSTKLNVIQRYKDEDLEEDFYSCAWTHNVDGSGQFWLLVAGHKGVLRVINCSSISLGCYINSMHLKDAETTPFGIYGGSIIGHGGDINDVKVHPSDPALAITASVDESIRLWNLRTGAVIAIFGGEKGHRAQVINVDFSVIGDKFVSGGLDNFIKIWDLSQCKEEIEASHRAADLATKDGYSIINDNGKREKVLKTKVIQFPIFSTRKVHGHYVDCVAFIGDFILSKSVFDKIDLWAPNEDLVELETLRHIGFYEPIKKINESLEHKKLGVIPVDFPDSKHEFTLIQQYEIPSLVVWFVRFGLDMKRRFMACGNAKGIIHIWDIEEDNSKPLVRLKHAQQEQVRTCAFSYDCKVLITVTDSGKVYRWNQNRRGCEIVTRAYKE